MNGARLSAAAQRAGQRYGIFLGAASSVFQQAANEPEPGSAQTQKRLAQRVYGIAEVWLGEERDHIEDAIAQEQDNANDTTLETLGLSGDELEEAAEAHGAEIAAELENSLRVQIERDLASLLRELRHISLRASLTSRARGVSRQQALLSLRQNGAGERLAFTVRDRAGKSWSSEKLVRTLWRQSLVMAWNETALLTMTERGIEKAEIQHPDEDHAENGTEISLVENPAMLSWDQVREDVFHPNTMAWLSPVR